jgi:hypothetical protein
MWGDMTRHFGGTTATMRGVVAVGTALKLRLNLVGSDAGCAAAVRQPVASASSQPLADTASALGKRPHDWPLCLEQHAERRLTLTTAKLELRNNAPENAIRLVALETKNWLFAGSDSWGKAPCSLHADPLRDAQRHRARRPTCARSSTASAGTR